MKKSKNESIEKIGQEIVEKPKRKANNPNGSPFLGDRALQVKPGDNSKYLNFSLAIMQLPDIELRDTEQVKERLDWYFKHCVNNDMKPAVSGLALALGVDRRRLWEIKTGNLPPNSEYRRLPREVTDLIKKAYKIMEVLWENYMQNGKINPVAGIFLGKNHYDYKDQSEYVLAPKSPLGEMQNQQEIAERYALDAPEDDENPKI